MQARPDAAPRLPWARAQPQAGALFLVVDVEAVVEAVEQATAAKVAREDRGVVEAHDEHRARAVERAAKRRERVVARVRGCGSEAVDRARLAVVGCEDHGMAA